MHASFLTPNQLPRPSSSPRNDQSGQHRPATIAELAERARDDLWDPSKALKFWLRTAEKRRRAGKTYEEAGDLESAFVEYAKAATIVLEKLPSHRDYHTTLNAAQRHNLGLNGQDLLDSLGIIKPTLVNLHERWLAQRSDDDFTQPSPGPSNSHQRDNRIRRSNSRRENDNGASIDPVDEDQEDPTHKTGSGQRTEQYQYGERESMEARTKEARRRVQGEIDQRTSGAMERLYRDSDGWHTLAEVDEEARRGPDPEVRRRDEAIAAAKRAAGTAPNNYYAERQPTPTLVSEAQRRRQDFDRQQAELRNKREEQEARGIARTEAAARAARRYLTPRTPAYQPAYRENSPSRLNGFPESQIGNDVPLVMPLERPTRHDDNSSTDGESVDEGQAPWRRNQSQDDVGTYRAPVRPPSYPPPVTTTSPAPGAGLIEYPTLMSQHQLKQALQSAFLNQGSSAPNVTGPSSSLLFVPEGPSQTSLYPSASLPLPNQPTSYVHGLSPPQYHSPEAANEFVGYPPAPIRRAPERAGNPIPREIKNVNLPRDCLPKFLSIAAINTARNQETCGLLLGKDKDSKFLVTTLLIPKLYLTTNGTWAMDEEEFVTELTEERSLIALGWIHTHPSQSCFMSSVDLHIQSKFQRMLPEFFAVICAPKSTPNFGIFRLTDPPGLAMILDCDAKEAFHPHPDVPIYTEADKGHVQMRDLPLEIIDLRSDTVRVEQGYHRSSPVSFGWGALACRFAGPKFEHSQRLPHIQTTLDDALCNFRAEMPFIDPQYWLTRNFDHIDKIVLGINSTDIVAGIDLDFSSLVSRGMIYKRLILYAFAHLQLCTRSASSTLAELKVACGRWKSLDEVTLLIQHRSIHDTLQGIIQEGLRTEQPSLHAPESLSQLMDLEAISLCAHLTIILDDSEKCKKMLKIENRQDAQSVLNLIQTCLELPLDPSIKRLHFKTLVRMSRTYGLYPDCLVLRGIEMNGQIPEAAGAYGDIYKGQLRGTPLALKVLRIYQRSDLHALLKGFSAEATIWRQLAHPNILPFYGIYHLEDTRVCFASPWMDHGNIVGFLKMHPNAERLLLVMDIASGLEYLHGHEPTIVHADLKGFNILITPARRACLADFGLATVKDSSHLTRTASTQKSVGTVRWQAPELLDSEPQGPTANAKESDVYAFACVCYEVFTGEFPFHDFEREVRVILSVLQGKRPQRPSPDRNGLDNDVWELIENCWDQNPALRPTAKQIIQRLSRLPNYPPDRRSSEVFDSPFSSQVLYPQTEHSVPAHRLSEELMNMLQAWRSKKALENPHGQSAAEIVES